jgi:hypothetical protein
VPPVSVAQIRRCGEATGATEQIENVLRTAGGSDLTPSFLRAVAERARRGQWVIGIPGDEVARPAARASGRPL